MNIGWSEELHKPSCEEDNTNVFSFWDKYNQNFLFHLYSFGLLPPGPGSRFLNFASYGQNNGLFQQRPAGPMARRLTTT